MRILPTTAWALLLVFPSFVILGCPAKRGPVSAGNNTSTPTSTPCMNGGTPCTPTITATPTHGTPVVTCAQFQNTNVGSYIIQTDYWNLTPCPGTQCMTIDPGTGAFSVTQGPNCGNTVASYPNVLYGCSFGSCSSQSSLPAPVSSLSCVTSSWSFSVGGTSSDQWDVAYDIWFCPDNSCGSPGFQNGLELMIWLDYLNTTGWQTDQGAVTLDGHIWDAWIWPQGSGGLDHTYLAYLIHPPMVTSVTNLDLKAFFQDAVNRGYLQNSWYLYAIQAGNELRTGGIPFTTNGFSVAVNSGC